MEPETGDGQPENKAGRRVMKTVWHGELFSDCRPTFLVKSVHRSQKALCEIQRESSILGTPNKVKVRLQNDINTNGTKQKYL